MVLYLNEDILNESIGSNEVVDAINNRTAVLINYADENASHTGKRYIEPYVFGVTKAGNDAIRAYQYWGDTKKGTPAWKLFRLDRIESWEPTGEKFELEPQARGWASQAFNKGGDKSLVKIYTIAKLDDEPLTDYEKLKAQNRALKNRKPVNIKDIDMSPIKKTVDDKQQVQSGPIWGDNKPTNITTQPKSPVKSEKNSNNLSKPVQNNGEQDNYQEPIHRQQNPTGPLIGNAQNPEEHKADELMSNDDFKKMLKRNLEITNQEKEKRNLNNQE